MKKRSDQAFMDRGWNAVWKESAEMEKYIGLLISYFSLALIETLREGRHT
jgi:hypothetical protein